MGEQFTVQLEGGSPWGFALQGGVDHRSPLRIGKVTPGGRAANGGLQAGDYILGINGQECKELKHLQAQQLVKKSTSTLVLYCTKVRPGVTSPSPRIVSPSPTFSFPITNGNKTPPIRNRLPSLTRPKPPPVPMTNGHARSSSLGMPNDTATNSATSASSPSSCSAMDAEDSKFLGMECTSGSLDRNHVQPDSVRKGSPSLVPDSEVVAQENLVFALQQNESKSESKDATPSLELNINDQNRNGNVNTAEIQNQNEDLKAAEEEVLVHGAVDQAELKKEEVESAIEYETKIVSDNVGGGVSSVVASGDVVGVAISGGGTIGVEVDDRKTPSSVSSHGSRGGSFSKWDLADTINQAAQARSSRESSMDLSSSFKSEDSSFDRHYQQQQQQQQKQKQQPQQPQALSRPPQKPQQQQYSSAGIPTGRPLPGPSSQTVIKPTLKVKRNSLDTREPGWYQQMFQTFSSKVDSDDEDDSSDSSYTYDHRGLKVRRNTLGKVSSEVQNKEAAVKREQSPSPESPLYVYDYRGLRVPVKKDKASQGGGHIRMGSTPAVMQGGSENQPPQEKPSTSRGTRFISVSSAGTTKEDVMSSSKRQTSFKSQHYSTTSTRNYWKQKDQDHIHFDKERRKSQEVIIHRRSSSSDIAAPKMTSHRHPLLRAEEDDPSVSSAGTSSGADNSGGVLNRIDAGKLHGALTNASMLGTLEQEGVPTQMLPAISQQNQLEAARKKEQEEKKKKLKPPPGPKALANFNFEGQTEKELSFEKGDFLDLTHRVDDNWLEGTVKGKTGIFPASYVKVLSASEYAAMTATRPETPKQKAKVLYAFQGQSDKELNLEQGMVVTIERKVDDNWYSGTVGDRKGIFPVTYVQIIEG